MKNKSSKLGPVRWLLPTLILCTFCLISLGGAVRAMNAGLACPDWPLCFGKIIPDFNSQVFYEWIHRKIAALVGLGTITVAVLVFRNKSLPGSARKTIFVSLSILATQIILGGLTVLKLLNFGVVTAHLAMGMAFLSSLLWLYFCINDEESGTSKPALPRGFTYLFLFTGLVVYTQIILGGLVSSNYAGLACPDVPLCQGQWIPTFEGLVGIQVIHRLGSYITFLTVFFLYRFMSANRKASWMDPAMIKIGRFMITLVLVQMAIGMANVKFGIPALITVLHLAMAATILGFALRLNFLGYKASASAKRKARKA